MIVYNKDIHSFAPLPSGPLPTNGELKELVRKARHRRAEKRISGRENYPTFLTSSTHSHIRRKVMQARDVMTEVVLERDGTLQ